MHPFTDRANSLGTVITFSLYGRLAIDLFTCEKLLLPNTKVRIKLIRARPNFYMLSDNPNIRLKTVDCSLFNRRILVAEPNHQYLQWNLEREPAQYKYMETIARTSIIPSRQNQFIQEKCSITSSCCNEYKFSCYRNFSLKPFQLSTIPFERA